MAAWTPEELAILIRMYPKVATSEIAAILRRPASAVSMKANRLGLAKSDERLSEMARDAVSHRRDR